MSRRESGLDPVLKKIAERIVDHHDNGGDVPYWVYVYPPEDEFAVRSDVVKMATWLRSGARRVACQSVSLAEIFWESLESSGMLDELVAQERDAADDPSAMAEVHRSVGQLLRLPPSLTERVASRLTSMPARSAAVLYRAGALYPGYRTSALLDDLRLRGGVRSPVVLLYPGAIEGDFGLRFMAKVEPAYGYRAVIVARNDLELIT